MPGMNKREVEEFLTSGQHILKLATLDPDGWPYVVATWYHFQDGALLLAGRSKSRWVEYLRRDSRVSVWIDTEGTDEESHRHVQMKGIAEIVDDRWTGDWSAWAIRYMGEDEGRGYYEETKHMPRVLVRITPEQTTTWAGGGWHPRYTED